MYAPHTNPLAQLQALQQKNATREYDDWNKRRNERSLTSSITGGMGYGRGADDYFKKMWDREDEQFLTSWLKTGRGPQVSHSYQGTRFGEQERMMPPGQQQRQQPAGDPAADAHAAHWLNQAAIRRANADANLAEGYALDAEFGARQGTRNVDRFNAEAPIRESEDRRMEAYLKGRYQDPAAIRGGGGSRGGGGGSQDLPAYDPSDIIKELYKQQAGMDQGTPAVDEPGWFGTSFGAKQKPAVPGDPRRADIDRQINDLIGVYRDRANGTFDDGVPQGGNMAPPQQSRGSRSMADVQAFAQAHGMSEQEAMQIYQSNGYAIGR